MKENSAMNSPKTIVYFKHGIGNLIMMTPAIKALASMDETGKVDICMPSEWNDSRRPAYDDFFEHWPEIVNNVVNYPADSLNGSYKRYFATGHAEVSEAFAVFTKKTTIQDVPDWRESLTHESEYYMNLVRKQGYKGKTPSLHCPVDENFILKTTKRPRIGLCNGTFSYKMQPVKQYPRFPHFSRVLKNYYGGAIVKLGFGEELKDVSADVDMVNRLSFVQSASIIKCLDLFITTDTALMHVGDALNVPMIAIFGGSLVSKNGPLSKNAHVVGLDMACRPCQKTNSFYSCSHCDCMARLPVGDIMHMVRRILK